MRRVIRKIKLKTVNVSRGRSPKESMEVATVPDDTPWADDEDYTLSVYDVARIWLLRGADAVDDALGTEHFSKFLRALVMRYRRAGYAGVVITAMEWERRSRTLDFDELGSRTPRVVNVGEDIHIKIHIDVRRLNTTQTVSFECRVDPDVHYDTPPFAEWRDRFLSELTHENPVLRQMVPIGNMKALFIEETSSTGLRYG